MHASPREVAHLRGHFAESIGLREILANLWRSRFTRWFAGIMPLLGSDRVVHVPSAAPFAGPGRLDLPRAPLPVPTAGHTSGHVGYLLPDDGVLVTGDALVSAHPTSALTGPQILPRWFQHDRELALATLEEFARQDVEHVLPGHGPALAGPIAHFVERAREQAAQS